MYTKPPNVFRPTGGTKLNVYQNSEDHLQPQLLLRPHPLMCFVPGLGRNASVQWAQQEQRPLFTICYTLSCLCVAPLHGFFSQASRMSIQTPAPLPVDHLINSSCHLKRRSIKVSTGRGDIIFFFGPRVLLNQSRKEWMSLLRSPYPFRFFLQPETEPMLGLQAGRSKWTCLLVPFILSGTQQTIGRSFNCVNHPPPPCIKVIEVIGYGSIHTCRTPKLCDFGVHP